jgi:hypothetical protein
MKIIDADRGRISYKVGGVGQPKRVDYAGLIEDFDAKALQTAEELVVSLKNGEKARFYRSRGVVYLSAPAQGVTLVARKVEK